jgi:hypothetical protein
MEAATSPDWLAERRADALASARELSLPGPKVKGWEFTDLSQLDLAAFEPAEPSDGAVEPGHGALAIPEGAEGLTQVDASIVSEVPAASGNGRPDAPLVMPLDAAAARFPELLREHLGTIVSGAEDPFVTINDAGWSGGALVYVPANTKAPKPISLTAIQKAAGRTLSWRTLVILEEGAEAELWERSLSADDEVAGLFNGVTELVVGPGANLRYVCGRRCPSPPGCSRRSAPRSSATPRSSGLRSDSDQPTARCGWRPSSPAAAPPPGSPAPTSATAASTSTTTQLRSMRPKTRRQTSRSAAFSMAAPRPCGAA